MTNAKLSEKGVRKRRQSVEALWIIACIDGSAVMKKILTYFDKRDPSVEVSLLPHYRAPSQDGLFLLRPYHYVSSHVGCDFHGRGRGCGWFEGEERWKKRQPKYLFPDRKSRIQPDTGVKSKLTVVLQP
jgi:hypothetical protein